MTGDTGLHCVVTGSSSGIGAALCRRLVKDGWRVTGIDMQAGPEDLSQHITTILADLSDASAAERAAAQVVKDDVTAFVHCAGVMRTGRIADMDTKDGELLWRLHVNAPSIFVKALAGSLPDRRGRIVMMSSRAILGRAGRGLYAASKAALGGLARCWAIELITRGITVNVVAAGGVDTPMLRDPTRLEAAPPSLPIGRLIRPEEIAATIAFLLSEDAGAMTGQTLMVCGGSSLESPPK